jgi:TonB family protein
MTASLGNVFAYSAQIATLAIASAIFVALLRVQSAGLRYGYFRVLLALCLLLPILQTPQPIRSDDVAAVTETIVTAGATRSTDPASGGTIEMATVIAWLLAGGFLARLMWLLGGWQRLRRLRNAGEIAAETTYADVQSAIGGRAEVRYVAALRQPVTFGIARPVVLLPDRLRAQPDDVRQAVIAHELWHVRRRDWAWVVGEELVRSIFWFHPAMWWLIARIRAAREEVVDALSVAVTGRRQAYVRALVAFADETPLAHAPGFAWQRHLFRRIVQISREDVMSSRRMVITSVLLAALVAVGGLYVVRTFPLTAVAQAVRLQDTPGPLERAARRASPDLPVPRRIHEEAPVYPSDPAARALSARVTIRATIEHDGSVGEARVIGLEFGTEHYKTAIHSDTEFAKSLENLYKRSSFPTAPGDPATAVATLAPALGALMQSALDSVRASRYEPPAEAPLSFDLTIHFAGPESSSLSGNGQAQESPLAEGALKVGGSVKPPQKLFDVRPIYPPDARAARVQGTVMAEVRIDPQGRVSDVRVVHSIPMLDQAAIDAISQWEFTPTLLNGVPTPVVFMVTVNFALR